MDVIINVSIPSAKDVYEFVFTSNKFKCQIDAVRGKYKVDAKSILGLFSLNLSEPITIIFNGVGDTEDLSVFNKWIVQA